MRPLVVLCVCTLIASCGRAPSGREQGDFERMRQQQRYDLFEESAAFPNGAVMQAPPANTVPRVAHAPWSGNVDAAGYSTGAAAGGDLAVVPSAMNEATLAAGREQFTISCAPCHGEAGFGGGIMAPNLHGMRPPSLRTPPASTLAAGTLFKVITNGFGRMPPYGWQIPIERRWAVVAYVRALTASPPTGASHADSVFAAYLHQLDSVRTLRPRVMLPVPSERSPQP